MNELSRAKRFIHEALLGDPDLASLVGERVCADVAPQGTAWPVVIFAALSGPDINGSGGVRVMTRPLFLVRGVTEGGGQTLAEQIADRIDIALQAASGRAGDGAYVAGVLREDTFEMVEEAAGKILRHLGGRYRVDIHTREEAPA